MGEKFPKEPQFPDSNNFKTPLTNYPKGILPSSPTKSTNMGSHFINTIENPNPNTYTNSSSYGKDETYYHSKKRKQFSSFGPRRTQFPGSSEFPNDNTYLHTFKSKPFRVNVGGYPEPKEYYQNKIIPITVKSEEKKKAKEENILKLEHEKKKQKIEAENEKIMNSYYDKNKGEI